MREMYKVMVSPNKTKSGQYSKRRIVWAAFFSAVDGARFASDLRKRNPTWVIETRVGYLTKTW